MASDDKFNCFECSLFDLDKSFFVEPFFVAKRCVIDAVMLKCHTIHYTALKYTYNIILSSSEIEYILNEQCY